MKTNEYALIELLCKRPVMYLGSNSITALWNFLRGYQFALMEFGKVCSGGQLFPLDFYFMHEYTAFLFGEPSTAGWRNQILWACEGDEEKALFRFFELFDEFKEIRSEKCWRAVLTADNIAYNDSMQHGYSMSGDDKQPIYKNPVCAYVIKLNVSAYLLAVETAAEIRVESFFFREFKDAAGSRHCSEGAEVYFGKINSWTEIERIHEYFNGKPVVIH